MPSQCGACVVAWHLPAARALTRALIFGQSGGSRDARSLVAHAMPSPLPKLYSPAGARLWAARRRGTPRVWRKERNAPRGGLVESTSQASNLDCPHFESGASTYWARRGCTGRLPALWLGRAVAVQVRGPARPAVSPPGRDERAGFNPPPARTRRAVGSNKPPSGSPALAT